MCPLLFSAGVLTTSPWNSINYEELSTTTFTTTISVGDGKFYQTRTFTLNVENVNEAPFFLQKYYAIYQLEGAVSMYICIAEGLTFCHFLPIKL